MKGQDLRYLAGVAELVRLDLEAAGLTLASDGERVMAIYKGNWDGGWREVGDEGGVEFTEHISAVRFRALAGLFGDDENVRLRSTKEGLELKGKYSTLNLQRRLDDSVVLSDVGADFGPTSFSGAVSLSGQALVEETDIASQYVAEATLRPILAGIRFQAGGKLKNHLLISAFDGYGLLYISRIPAKVFGEFDLVVPTLDFMLGLKLTADPSTPLVLGKLKNEDIVIAYNGSKTATFRCCTLAGDWPDLEAITGAQLVGTRLTVLAEQARALVASGRAFDTKEVSLVPSGGKSIFKVISGEGGYTINVNARLDAPTKYAIDALNKVARIGPELDFTVPPTSDMPTLIRSGDRRCWMVARF